MHCLLNQIQIDCRIIFPVSNQTSCQAAIIPKYMNLCRSFSSASLAETDKIVCRLPDPQQESIRYF